jgi:nitronate monooxygenase
MTLPDSISARMGLPVICAPMFLISNPALVIAACTAGVLGSFPMQNTRSREEFEAWLREITETLATWAAETGGTPGPLGVNIPTTLPLEEIGAGLDLCARYGVDVIITSVGKPTEVTRMAHDRGLLVHHDVTSLLFAEKAIAAGVDGLNCIGAGGGGHSGTVSHLALIPKVRTMFDGTVSLAGAVSTGAAVRAAEVLGADLAFMGSRFAATVESMADDQQKAWMVSGTSADLRYTAKVNGVPANWMLASLVERGIDIDALPEPQSRGHDHLPEGVRPWRDLWSAGQGIELIDDIPTVAQLVERLTTEYLVACAAPDRAEAAARVLKEKR